MTSAFVSCLLASLVLPSDEGLVFTRNVAMDQRGVETTVVTVTNPTAKPLRVVRIAPVPATPAPVHLGTDLHLSGGGVEVAAWTPRPDGTAEVVVRTPWPNRDVKVTYLPAGAATPQTQTVRPVDPAEVAAVERAAAEIWLHRFTEEDVLAGRIVSDKGKLNLLVSRAMGKKSRRMR